ncbi:MAG: bifunctional pyr operon transcriptional regulator/uracil phosphoribosyltransferase PyrR [Actinomycetota bacterium]
MSKRTVLSSDDIRRAITRISHEILEQNRGSLNLLLVGIPTRGVNLANRIAEVIKENSDSEVLVGSLDVTMYRDDLSDKPTRPVGTTDLPNTGVAGKVIVLVDDVLFSGRTIRAALDALNDHGRPSAVRLAVLVDRGHRQLPIRADFVGKNLPTAFAERISVKLQEVDGLDEVVIED